jgi:hypothetical protein
MVRTASHALTTIVGESDDARRIGTKKISFTYDSVGES